jgi:outer membrane protein
MFSYFRSARLLLVTTAAIAATSLLPAQEFAPTKVAIINLQLAVSQTAEIKKDVAAMEQKYGPRQKAVEALQKELVDIQKQGQTPNMQPGREAELQSQFTTKQKQLQRLQEDLQADVNAERQDVLGRVGRQMSDVVKTIAEERGLDVIVEVSNTLYFKPALDLTAAATAAYDKAHPIK